MPPKDITSAVQYSKKGHTTRMPSSGTRYIDIFGEPSRKVIDAAVDNNNKRKRGAKNQMQRAARYFNPSQPIWEFRLTLPKDLDILYHRDVSAAMMTAWELTEGAVTFARLEDVRSLTTQPTAPHMHGVTQAPLHHLVGSVPGLWVREQPLDPDVMVMSTDDQPTLYGFFHYASKCPLDGANRRKPNQLKLHGTDQALLEHAAAIDRLNEAQQRAWGEGRRGRPRTSDWLNTDYGAYCLKAYHRTWGRRAA